MEPWSDPGRFPPAAAPLPATAATIFTGLFAFGDSLTDAGNTNPATAGALPGAGY